MTIQTFSFADDSGSSSMSQTREAVAMNAEQLKTIQTLVDGVQRSLAQPGRAPPR